MSRMDPLEKPMDTLSPKVMGACRTPLWDDHDERYGVPSLEELGMKVFLILMAKPLFNGPITT